MGFHITESVNHTHGVLMKVNKALLNRYNQLQRLRKTNKLTEVLHAELMDVCEVLMNQLLQENSELLKRLKVSDVNTYNTSLKGK